MIFLLSRPTYPGLHKGSIRKQDGAESVGWMDTQPARQAIRWTSEACLLLGQQLLTGALLSVGFPCATQGNSACGHGHRVMLQIDGTYNENTYGIDAGRAFLWVKTMNRDEKTFSQRALL